MWHRPLVSFPAFAAEKPPLVLGLFPYVTPVQLAQFHTPLKDYLARKLDRPVTLVTAPDFMSFVERTREGQYDPIITAPHLGRLAETCDGYQRLAQTGHTVQGIFLAPADSGIHRIEDLRGKRVMIAQKVSIIYQLAEQHQIHVSNLDDVEQARRHLEMQWSVRIPYAVERDRFVLHFQKVLPLDPASGQLPRCELLVRMLDENGSLILPGRLIPAAKRFRHMPEIDRWVIRHALQLIARNSAGAGMTAYAINLSGQSMGQEELLDFVRREILRSGVRPSLLTFEITETAAIRNISQAARFMSELKKMGCQFALDDFGSGLSSFGYLKMLPVDYLKIDGSFVRNMVHDEHDHSTVVAISQIAKTLKIACVAEFVEDEPTLRALQAIGVDYAQGYFLHRPEDFAAHAASRQSSGGLAG